MESATGEPAARTARVLGIAGWSGAGKTTLIVKLIPLFVARGLRVATLKHAHHAFDVDTPGKDSWLHREAGAAEVMVVSQRRWALMHELREEPEPPLHELLSRLSPCDLVLVEGYKREPLARLEVYRAAVGKPALYPDDPHVVAVATDSRLALPHPPAVDINDAEAVADTVLAHARALPQVLAQLADPSG